MPNLVDALILGIVEGLTEFLPISSTGHLILAGDLIAFQHPGRDVFYVAIQTGAMLAVVWEYRTRFFRVDPRLWMQLACAFAPAVALGLLLGDLIKEHLFRPVPVALAFIIGGLIILVVDRGERVARVQRIEDMSWRDALKVGFAQCFALIPGTSRSGATIIGGMLFGLSRPAATEFSFFLAVPTLVAAGGYDVWKRRDVLSPDDAAMWAVGLATSFVAAFVVIRWLVRYVATHDFRWFAWYRIAFGLLVLATAYFGWIEWRAD